MTGVSRREFLKAGMAGAAGAAVLPSLAKSFGPVIRTGTDGLFRMVPHPWMPEPSLVYAADAALDPFQSSIRVTPGGIVVPQDMPDRPFSVNLRWYVDGFGWVVLAADNGGDLYTAKDFQDGRVRSLNFEFARSRVMRNRAVRKRYEKDGIRFSGDVRHLIDLSEELLENASPSRRSENGDTEAADRSLGYALWAGEKIELEKAGAVIEAKARAARFGCETRQYIWAKSEPFVQRFLELFGFATVTHYVWDTWYPVFEPEEGKYRWGIKDEIVGWLLENDVSIEGRPLFWFHPSVTPEWLRNKDVTALKKYVVSHARDLVGHYRGRIREWEVFNEYHDWANLHDHTPEQITDIVRLGCDTVREADPGALRLLNNCHPWADYVARGRMAGMNATRPLRTPRKFIADLLEAGVDFDVLGIQIYFPQRDLSDIVRMVERFEAFGKPLTITEIGATSGSGSTSSGARSTDDPTRPFDWHRRWDEELQADWLEQVYTVLYARPSITTICWYDFSDFRPYIADGGLITEDSSPKKSYFRLKDLFASWGRLPRPKKQGNIP